MPFSDAFGCRMLWLWHDSCYYALDTWGIYGGFLFQYDELRGFAVVGLFVGKGFEF
jgi:hypothetical protein